MNIPQLPTDNLYKFMALVGVLVTLASLLFPGYQLFEIGRQQITAETEFEVLKERGRLLEAETEDLDRERNELSRDIVELKNRHNTSTKDINALDARNIMYRQRYAELRTKRSEVLANASLVGGKLEEISRLLQWATYSLLVTVIGTALGLTLAFKGFNLWYQRVQIHQDALLRKQVHESET